MWKLPRMQRTILTLGSLALLIPLLSSCGTMGFAERTEMPGRDASVGEFCEIAKPILWSAHDTSETIKQVKEHNAKGKALCKWGAQGGGD
mgnify:CR=1 FL=1